MLASMARIFQSWMITFSIGFSGIVHSFFTKKSVWEFWFHKWAAAMMATYKLSADIEGREHLQGPGIFIMNHQSVIDIFALPHISPYNSAIVAKKEISFIPLVGRLMKLGGCIFVDRKNKRKAVSALNQGINGLTPGHSILIFPEGTRGPGPKLLKLKKGVFHLACQTKLPIIPIGQMGASKLCYNKSFPKLPGTMYFNVGKPIPTDDFNSENIAEKMLLLQESLEEVFQQAKKRYELSEKTNSV